MITSMKASAYVGEGSVCIDLYKIMKVQVQAGMTQLNVVLNY